MGCLTSKDEHKNPSEGSLRNEAVSNPLGLKARGSGGRKGSVQQAGSMQEEPTSEPTSAPNLRVEMWVAEVESCRTHFSENPPTICQNGADVPDPSEVSLSRNDTQVSRDDTALATAGSTLNNSGPLGTSGNNSINNNGGANTGMLSLTSYKAEANESIRSDVLIE
eukprot:TRINITY_DN2407_c0_g3_i11.p3 TRINITY_DN2407_c0_g3~~TRINITY_DN2407_c0_g3_i11.p3  ORF type:complete len:166 (+),score=12.09 TRINITY_DN2407_c0_g3_i11:160-657(+)